MELENEKLEQEQIEEVKETREEFKARIKGCLSSRGSKNQSSEERKKANLATKTSRQAKHSTQASV